MGLGRWWLTHGPGSPGSIARAMATAYVNLKRANPIASHEELLRAVLASRYAAFGGSDPQVMARLLAAAEGRLSQLSVVVWQEEDKRASGAMLNAPEVYGMCLEIIMQETMKITPEAK